MKPRSTSVETSRTVVRSPTSSPSKPRTTRPSTGGRTRRTHVPFPAAPVTIASKRAASAYQQQAAARGYRVGAEQRPGPDFKLRIPYSLM